MQNRGSFLVLFCFVFFEKLAIFFALPVHVSKLVIKYIAVKVNLSYLMFFKDQV